MQPGDRVRAGDPLQDGPPNPHDILRVKGEKELAAWLVNEIQQVYRLQGVTINDKHIEVIVRQMLRRVRIKEVGDTNFLVDEQVEKHVFERENARRSSNAAVSPAVAEPLLLGITKASPLDRVVHQRVVVPGDDQGAHRGRDLRQDRRLCAASRRTSSWVASSRPAPACRAYKTLNVVVDGEPLVMPREAPRPRHDDVLITAVNEE